jgi:hypothetical protein
MPILANLEATDLRMINPDLACPDCGQRAYVAPTPSRDMRSLLGALCHCCGHALNEDDIARYRKELSAAGRIRGG